MPTVLINSNGYNLLGISVILYILFSDYVEESNIVVAKTLIIERKKSPGIIRGFLSFNSMHYEVSFFIWSTISFFLIIIMSILLKKRHINKGFYKQKKLDAPCRASSWERRNRTKSLWGNVSLLAVVYDNFLMSIK